MTTAAAGWGRPRCAGHGSGGAIASHRHLARVAPPPPGHREPRTTPHFGGAAGPLPVAQVALGGGVYGGSPGEAG
eukprot:11085469-Lingulodinium_polyedra.AAC.1